MNRTWGSLFLSLALATVVASAACSSPEPPDDESVSSSPASSPLVEETGEPVPLFHKSMPVDFCDSIASDLPLLNADSLAYELSHEDGNPKSLGPRTGYECRFSAAESNYVVYNALGGQSGLILQFKRSEQDETDWEHDWLTLDVSPPEFDSEDWVRFITDSDDAMTTFTCRASLGGDCEDGAEVEATGRKVVIETSYINLYVSAVFHHWGADVDEGDAETVSAETFGMVVTRLVEEMERS